jgi:hypothetical protein
VSFGAVERAVVRHGKASVLVEMVAAPDPDDGSHAKGCEKSCARLTEADY